MLIQPGLNFQPHYESDKRPESYVFIQSTEAI